MRFNRRNLVIVGILVLGVMAVAGCSPGDSLLCAFWQQDPTCFAP